MQKRDNDNCLMNAVLVIQVILCCILLMISCVKNIILARTLFSWVLITVLIMAGMIWGTLREKVADFRNRGGTRETIIKLAVALIATVVTICVCALKLFFKIS